MKGSRVRPALVAIAALMIGVACEVVPESEFETTLNVQAMVMPAEGDTVVNQVFVNRTYHIDEAWDSIVRGAEVLVCPHAGQDTWRYFEARFRRTNPTLHYWAYADSQTGRQFGLKDTVRLRVVKDGFDTVVGRTVIPDSFSILWPEPGDTVTVDDSLVWTRSRGCRGYYMSFRTTYQGEDFSYAVLIPNESTPGVPYDSLVERVPMFFLAGETAGDSFRINLTALDSNYCAWVEAGQGPARRPNALPYCGVEGGIGVFGSGVLRYITVIVSEDTLGGQAVRGRATVEERLAELQRRAPAGVLVLAE